MSRTDTAAPGSGRDDQTLGRDSSPPVFPHPPATLPSVGRDNESPSMTHRTRDGGTERGDFRRAELERRRHLSAWSEVRRPTFTLKHEWIGRIDEVRADSFTVTLASRDRPGELESAELELEEVSPEDLDKVRPGAIFYWIIGYRDEPYGQRIGVSTLRFRHLVAPSSEQLLDADREAAEMFRFLSEA